MDWYPFFFQIYKADTMHLDPYQDGCYRRLIDHYMETRQPLPDNDHALARIVGDSHPNWVAMASAIVRPFFVSKNGLLYHKKCDSILNNQDKRTKRLSESGKKGADKRWKENNDLDSHAIATPLGSAIAEERRGEKNKKESPHSPPKGFLLPDWIPTDDWNDWEKMRKAKRAPLTDAARKTAVAKLEKLRKTGHDPGAVLQQSTFNAWQGLFEIKGENRNGYRQRSFNDRVDEAGKRSLELFLESQKLQGENDFGTPDPKL